MIINVVVAVLAFLGAALGSALASWATLRASAADRRERRRAGDADRIERRREEWGRRFSGALAAVTSTDPVSRATGRALLRELLNSELAGDDDRRMAVSVLDAAATGRAAADDLGTHLEDVIVVRDTGNESTGGPT